MAHSQKRARLRLDRKRRILQRLQNHSFQIQPYAQAKAMGSSGGLAQALLEAGTGTSHNGVYIHAPYGDMSTSVTITGSGCAGVGAASSKTNLTAQEDLKSVTDSFQDKFGSEEGCEATEGTSEHTKCTAMAMVAACRGALIKRDKTWACGLSDLLQRL